MYSAYRSELELERRNGCYTVAFPLISSEIYGYPVEAALDAALQACVDFVEKNPNYFMVIEFAVLNDRIRRIGEAKVSELHRRKLEEMFQKAAEG